MRKVVGSSPIIRSQTPGISILMALRFPHSCAMRLGRFVWFRAMDDLTASSSKVARTLETGPQNPVYSTHIVDSSAKCGKGEAAIAWIRLGRPDSLGQPANWGNRADGSPAMRTQQRRIPTS
jgi:hypothetical protein